MVFEEFWGDFQKIFEEICKGILVHFWIVWEHFWGIFVRDF